MKRRVRRGLTPVARPSTTAASIAQNCLVEKGTICNHVGRALFSYARACPGRLKRSCAAVNMRVWLRNTPASAQRAPWNIFELYLKPSSRRREPQLKNRVVHLRVGTGPKAPRSMHDFIFRNALLDDLRISSHLHCVISKPLDYPIFLAAAVSDTDRDKAIVGHESISIHEQVDQ